MELPHVVVAQLDERQKVRYHRHFDSDRSGWHRRWTESIWRRHQDPANAALSGWRSPEDRRRRLIHFYDEYGVEGDAFVLRHTSVWLNVTLPADEIDGYLAAIRRGLTDGGWSAAASRDGWASSRRGHLRADYRVERLHPEDAERGIALPASYRSLTLRLRSEGYATPAGLERRPWRWFYDVGMRPMLPPGRPEYVEPEELVSALPAQLELGCGPSTEAGVPHLSNLHRIYGVSRGDFSFVFDAADDGLLDVLSDPERKFREMTDIYRACMVAEPTPFYHGVRAMFDRGLLVGPVITNNFDCLCAEMELEEMSLRRYDTEPYFPMYDRALHDGITFDPRARTLLVVGVHADRRLAQRRARAHGLRVAYVDPERYLSPDGEVMSYRVEAPQDGDLFVRLPAGEAFPRLLRALDVAPTAAVVAPEGLARAGRGVGAGAP